MEVYLPKNFDEVDMYSFISEILNDLKLPKSYEITINFSTLKFIKPSGITILHNIISWLKKHKVKIHFNGLPDNPNSLASNNPIKYLDDSGFFKFYFKKTLSDSSSLRSTTFPRQKISYEEYFAWLSNQFIPWIAETLNIWDIAKKDSSGLEMCIQEIFNNIIDHSEEKIACFFAQHYPQKNPPYIEIAISDFGVGIPYRIREKHQEIQTDKDALILALKKSFTTKTIPSNRGYGLKNLIGFVVETNNGEIKIHSNYGIIHCRQNNGKKEILSNSSNSFYPGTLILMKVMTNTLLYDYIEEDIKW